LYLYEPGSFKPLCFIERNQVYYYHLDHLGTPQEMTDWEGRIVWSARYRAYGNVLKQEVAEVENNLRFQGQYFDAETGLHYNRFRYYDPGTGQFVQQDPVGLLGGVNNYQYASNPAGWIDPLGLTCKELTSWNQFQKDTKGHFENSTETAKSYNRMKEVQAMEKGTRPDPSTYLPQSYIDTHLQKFDNGASRIVTRSDYEKYGFGKPDATNSEFMSTKADVDAIVKSANGDVTKIAADLGIPVEQLEKGSLVRIDVVNPRYFDAAMPSGNEFGANKQWIPGGKLPTGKDEIVVSASKMTKSDLKVTDLKTGEDLSGN
jgi:RHS repeat-associated protein